MKLKELAAVAGIASFVTLAASFALSPPFVTVWNPAYEAIPADTEQESLGASRIRDLKFQLRARLSQDHSWAGDGNDGYHKQVTLVQQTADCVPAFDASATGGCLYSKNVGGISELFFKDSGGNIQQVTSQGQLAGILSGSVMPWPMPSAPAGWNLMNGGSVPTTNCPKLFALIGYTYGGSGANFFMPDARGRTIAGYDASNTTGRLNLSATGGISASTVGNVGGQQAHTQVLAEIAAHTHTVVDPGHIHGPFAGTTNFLNAGGSTTDLSGTGANGVSHNGTTASATTGITLNNAGSGTPFNVVQPGIVMNWIIKC